MKCENLQLNLSVYLDDCLTEGEHAEIENHLPHCPLCRQKLADFQSMRNDLRILRRPALSDNLLIQSKVELHRKHNLKSRSEVFLNLL